MKQLNTFKLLLVALVCATASANGQTVRHPLAFGADASYVDSNWYKDYVGFRFAVTAPSVIAGDYINVAAGNDWVDIRDTDLFNIPVIMPGGTDDTCACSAITATSMTGMIALVWRGPLSAPCNFTDKAYRAQQAGALAVVIINEYPGQEAIPMGYVAAAGPVHIPVFMIGNIEGSAIDAVYHSVPAGTIKMTITHWGQNLTHDLGFVPSGTALWHSFAYPSNQMTTSNEALKGLDGAFIANYGLADATNVKLAYELSFTPASGGGTTVEHSGTLDGPTLFKGCGQALPANRDSIYTVFSTTEYNLTKTVNGRYDMKYTISADATDDFPGDNTVTNSFYLTDSLYSKGRYDMANNVPIRTVYFGGENDFTWGNMYFVGPTAGTAIEKIQYSLASNVAGPLGAGQNHIFIWKWVDGSNSEPLDSIVQNGELDLVSNSTYVYGGPGDTTDGLLTVGRTDATNYFSDASGSTKSTIFLEPNTWYYVSVEVPGASGTPYYLGQDGIVNPLPRVYGRFFANGIIDYSNFSETGVASDIQGTPDQGVAPVDLARNYFIQAIDSYNYHANKGIIPAIAMIANNHPDTTTTPPDPHVGVNNVAKAFADVALYPNPASEELNVSIKMDKTAGKVSYMVLDGLGRVVSKEVHNNVKDEVYVLPTSRFPAGNYYMIIDVDLGKSMTKKFTIAR